VVQWSSAVGGWVDARAVRCYDESVSMKRERVARLTGKPGNWVAVELKTRKVVAEATTLKAVARIVERKRLKRTSFTRVPSPDCALIL